MPKSVPGYPPPARAQRGIALMLVLWIIALLTIIAIGMTSVQRTESTLAANQLGSARFRALADAAIHFTALNLTSRQLLETPPDEQEASDLWIPDGEPNRWSFGSETLNVAVFNESSFIDLNSAPRELIVALLSAIGLPEEEQAELADAILDWRDSDDLHLLNGAEDPDYEAADLPYGAKDGPFHSVEELGQVQGIDAELYRSLAPALTVASGKSPILKDLAPPLVRAALEGLTIEEMEEQLLEESATDIPGTQPPTLNRGGPLYRVQVSQEGSDGTGRSMEALIRVQPANADPVAILWRRFSLGQQPVSDAADEQTD